MCTLGVLAIIATLINLAYSYFERVENFFWNWPSYGLIAIGMFHDKAYATAIMLILQAVISSYGFLIWTRQRNLGYKEQLLSFVYDKYCTKLNSHSVIDTSSMKFKEHGFCIVGAIICFIMVYLILGYFQDIDRIADASSFAIFAVASILLNLKKLESWLYYIIADGYSMLLAYKGNNVYNCIAMGFFITINFIIFLRWRKNIKLEHGSNISNFS